VVVGYGTGACGAICYCEGADGRRPTRACAGALQQQLEQRRETSPVKFRLRAAAALAACVRQCREGPRRPMQPSGRKGERAEHLATEGEVHRAHHDVMDGTCARDGGRGLGLRG
jgi:hypothetical protein